MLYLWYEHKIMIIIVTILFNGNQNILINVVSHSAIIPKTQKFF